MTWRILACGEVSNDPAHESTLAVVYFGAVLSSTQLHLNTWNPISLGSSCSSEIFNTCQAHPAVPAMKARQLGIPLRLEVE